jgi:hypothetical protein
MSAPFDACARLGKLLRDHNVVVDFDDRRYARAALEWPDHLPPMFGEANVARERWGIDGRWGIWDARAPDAWPVPTVAIGETWEAKSDVIPWLMAEGFTEARSEVFSIIRVQVVQLAGEYWLDEEGLRYRMSIASSPHWRRVP